MRRTGPHGLGGSWIGCAAQARYTGRNSLEQILRSPEELILEPTRLRVILHLVETGGVAKFVDIARNLDIKTGALSVHGRKLEDAGIISIQKAFEGRLPVTSYQVTAKGRSVLAGHKASLVAIEPEEMRA
jgi:DNA-binding MarR family transcriptional regulator